MLYVLFADIMVVLHCLLYWLEGIDIKPGIILLIAVANIPIVMIIYGDWKYSKRETKGE